MAKSKKNWWILALVGGGLLTMSCCCAGGGLLWALAPRDDTHFSSDGPDGWRVVVTHHAPGWLKQSPHTYDVTFVNIKTGKPAGPTPGHLDTGSATLHGLMVGWIPGFCTLHEIDPGRHVFVGTLPSGPDDSQLWLVMEATPNEKTPTP
jgi:hypothetical protein